MTKADIVERIYSELGISKKEASVLVESVFSIMKHSLAFGEEIKISGFGKFEVKQKKDRKGRNPQTGEAITIVARKITTFKPSAVLKTKINRE